MTAAGILTAISRLSYNQLALLLMQARAERTERANGGRFYSDPPAQLRMLISWLETELRLRAAERMRDLPPCRRPQPLATEEYLWH